MSEEQQKSEKAEFPFQEYRLLPIEELEHDHDKENEIDLLELAKTIWNKKVLILRFVIIGAMFGIFIAINTPKVYKSTSKLLPEYNSNSQSGASGLLQQYGGLLGISSSTYNANSNALRVDLYPTIVSSLPFQMDLANTPFYIPKYDTTVSLMTYYREIKTPGLLSIIKGNTIGLPSKILGKFMGLILPKSEDPVINSPSLETSTILNLPKAELNVINSLSRNVVARLDREAGIVTVSATMDDPMLAAQVAEHTIKELTIYLTDYRTQKLRTDLAFIEKQLAKSKTRFEEAQEELASFREQFQGTVSIRNQTEQQRLNSEYQIAFELYNTFTQRLEQTRLKLQEETPLFKVLEPVKVPVDDESNGVKTLIIYVMISGMLSLGWIFVPPLFERLRNNPSDPNLSDNKS
ncbi:MAG: Wzz/FepE/Etk N-terminal domain-containing protein [bacterium]|nr:Wzz/FepE/Etk N-terminal domain-containing protein [bacterium]